MNIDLVAFIGITFLLEVTPGPAVLFILFQSSRGISYVVASILGLLTANILWISLVATGLGLLLVSSVTLFTGLRYIGALYLVYLGYRIMRYGVGTPKASSAHKRAEYSFRSYFHAYRQGIFTSLSNPKALLFFLALFPQFIRVDNYAQDILLLGAIKMLTLTCIMGTYGLMGKSFFNRITHSSHAVWVFRVFGAVIIIMSYGVAFG